MDGFAKMLAGGDRRSIGSAEVVRAVAAAPDRFAEVWACLRHADPLVRMRAADAVEKLTRENAAPLAAHKAALIAGDLDDGSKEVGWHLVALLARLSLSAREAETVFAGLAHRLDTSDSAIVRVMALQAAADLAARHPSRRKDFFKMLDYAKTASAPALKARTRKLAAELERT